MRYSYIRGSSRLTWAKTTILKYSQSIFSSRMLRFLYNGGLWINVEESSFSRSIKTNYAWLPKGWSSAILNSNCTGRASLIFGLWSNGHWVGAIVNDSTNTEKFWLYLMMLHHFIEKWLYVNPWTVKVWLDNASIHLSKKWKLAAYVLRLELNGLPQYSPNLAPVELAFGFIKQKIRRRKDCKYINFSKQGGVDSICEALNHMNTQIGKSLCRKFVIEAKNAILAAQQRQINTFIITNREADMEIN